VNGGRTDRGTGTPPHRRQGERSGDPTARPDRTRAGRVGTEARALPPGEYERLYAGDGLEIFLVDWGHWEEIGDEIDATDRELSAIRRAHEEEQLLRIGRRTDREDEFETALEIREPVVIGTNENGTGGDTGGERGSPSR